MLIIPFVCIFFFSSNKIFHHSFLSPYRSQSLQILYNLQRVEVSCAKENHNAELSCDFFLPFSFFISHSSVMHWEIVSKDFSGTITPRILKMGTNIGYDLLYHVRKNQHPHIYHSLNLSMSNRKFYHQKNENFQIKILIFFIFLLKT